MSANDHEITLAWTAEEAAHPVERGRCPESLLLGHSRQFGVDPRDATGAATLLGASVAIHRQIGLTIAPDEQIEHDELEARFRAALSSEAFMQAWDRGAAIDADGAAELALSLWQTPSPSPS